MTSIPTQPAAPPVRRLPSPSLSRRLCTAVASLVRGMGSLRSDPWHRGRRLIVGGKMVILDPPHGTQR